MLVRTSTLLAGGGLAAWALSSCVLVTGGVPGAGGAAGGGGSVTTSSSSSSITSSSSSTASSSSSTSADDSGAPASPTCADGTQNGLETDVDCGGDACPPCPLGDKCLDDADCNTGDCAAGHCAPTITVTCAPVTPGSPTCDDCTQDGLETDVDCGGDACPPCPDGKACLDDADCTSGHCAQGTCAVGTPACQPVDPANPSCADCVKDGTETDVDCGGDACPPCAPVMACQTGADCLSGACATGTCQHGAAGSACFDTGDCASGTCAPGQCWTGQCCG